MDRSLLRGLSAALAGLLLAAGVAQAESAAPAPVPCPLVLPEGTRCLDGLDGAGAF